MKGRYTTWSLALGLAVVLLFLGLEYALKLERSVVLSIVVPAVMLAMIVLTNYLPCSFEADDTGFTIGPFIRKRRFNYADVAGVSYEFVPYGFNKRRPHGKLTVTTRDGRTIVFRENAGSRARSGLARLSDYLNARIY